MRVAILGATSQIVKDLIRRMAESGRYQLFLYARRPVALPILLGDRADAAVAHVGDYASFSAEQEFDALINFVGVGNPAAAAKMGADILDVTLQFDQIALNYLHAHPHCRYIFLSSGAAYGSNFEHPVDASSCASIAINHLRSQDWYAVAKLHAECRHRALTHLPIVDVRVFNYFSRTQDMSARFFITDVLRAIQSGEILVTSPDNIVRDYIGPDDFFQLISRSLAAPAANDVVDCYTQDPVDKFTLLASMKDRFGLHYEVSQAPAGINATGLKMNYFSRNRRAEAFGYVPSKSSLQTVLDEAAHVLQPRPSCF